MRILFATDGSIGAQNARDFLGSLPLTPGTELLVVSIVPCSRTEEVNPASTEETEQRRSWADLAAYRLARAGLSTDSLLVEGHPAEQICRLAEQKAVDLVVMGSRGRAALARFLLGSVSYQVLKHAPASVLLVKRAFRPIEKAMIGVDGSADSDRAVAFLRTFPLPPEVSVEAVHVIQVRPPFCSTSEGYSETAEMSRATESLRVAAEAEGKRVLVSAAEALEGSYRVETLISEGPAANTLVDLVGSRGSDLLVVGSRGLTGVDRFLMGSVSTQVAVHAPCSVLVVR
jgi:nucleotide-binding universal stress UspA family protein